MINIKHLSSLDPHFNETLDALLAFERQRLRHRHTFHKTHQRDQQGWQPQLAQCGEAGQRQPQMRQTLGHHTDHADLGADVQPPHGHHGDGQQNRCHRCELGCQVCHLGGRSQLHQPAGQITPRHHQKIRGFFSQQVSDEQVKAKWTDMVKSVGFKVLNFKYSITPEYSTALPLGSAMRD